MNINGKNQKNSDVFISIAVIDKYAQNCGFYIDFQLFSFCQEILVSGWNAIYQSLFHDVNIMASRYSTTKVSFRITDPL